MRSKQVTLAFPVDLYQELVQAKEENNVGSIAEYIRQAVLGKLEENYWRRNLGSLQQEIRKSGGIKLGETKEETIEHLRKTRRKIFQAEYDHLYR